MQPARDVYAVSTNQLEILSVAGCEPGPKLSANWRDSFRCSLPSLKPGESRTWTAQVRYLPATTRADTRAARDAVRLPLAEDPNQDVSTFCVLVVPKGATNLNVILGQDGPLRFVFGSNDPNVIGFTVTPGEGSANGGAGGTTNVGSTNVGTGGNGGNDGSGGNNGNGGNNPTAPGSLPKTGVLPWELSIAGGALGLLILGCAMVGLARMRMRDAEPV
ncbi:hypothetical protein [Yinghuangia seranimata]|uniref:hypothetical protein n=1 Tax=Yinghuangia seranimata TaxID=408067 RepID=UPI00248B9117|nr:hypothetical protein [Yinghuangia seranimata]MDI2127516.1 hypothetical protein [Yinghuangia seranimata]